MMQQLQAPTDRMGIFKTLSDVPEARRLYQHANAYEGKDTWSNYRAMFDFTERTSEEWERYSRRWKENMADQGRHHALAQPKDVEAWSEQMLSQFSVDRAYQHWNVIEGFYDWLKWHTEHPHTYNPFHMAAMEADSCTRTIWNQKMEKKND